MEQEEKKKYIEESIDSDAQIYFENHCNPSDRAIEIMLEKHPLMTDCILDLVNLSIASAFCQGVFYGWSRSQKVDIENLPQEIKDLNYLFAFNFHDNDFGDYFLEGAEKFCSILNKLFIGISLSNRDKMENTTNELKDKINDFISLDNLINYIAKGVYVFHLNERNINIPIGDIFEESKHTVDSFSIEKKESYIFGDINTVSEKLINDNAKYQMEPKNELRDLWLNGEYLFVKIENGFANAWIQ